MVAGGLAWAAAGVGLVAGIVLPTIEVAKRDKKQRVFYDGLVPTLEKYGLTGGPEQPMIMKIVIQWEPQLDDLATLQAFVDAFFSTAH